ncbi:NmrA family NAD(P)-binding protein [Streptomyces sp. NPDC056529]|uniref:NmrA family NAD(P)-binding protein n=1 Tax=Streptomyces sp. NPDC056529 TaxID=3345855 RepID=UPI003690845B
MTVLVTGATGRVGRHVLQELNERGVPARAAVHRPAPDTTARAVSFSFTDPRTWREAMRGATSMFVMRPPQISRVKEDMLPALSAAREYGVKRMVLLSLQGADRNPAVPHHTLENWLRASGLEWTFVRAGFFMQNLSTTHAAEIRDLGRIVVPAGGGRTSFVDARDVAAVAVRALTDDTLVREAVTPTGVTALTYTEVAELISTELGAPVSYISSGPLAFWRHRRAQGTPHAETAVMLALYSACRFNLAAGVTHDVRTVLGRDPISFSRFAHDERAAWLPRPHQPFRNQV